METLVEILRYVQIAAFAALAGVCLRQWLTRRDEPALWALLTFGLLAAVSASGLVTDALTGDDPPDWLSKLIISLVLLFPYFLFRFAAAFSRPSGRIEFAAAALTGVAILWTAVLRTIPAEGEPRPDSFVAFVIAVLIQWTSLSLWVAGRLWTAGRQQPTVVRYRMRLLAAGTVGLSLAIILAGLRPQDRPAWIDLTNGALMVAVALLFFAGFAPPRTLRKIWRGPEEEVLRRSVDDLLTAAGPDELLGRVLPQMAALVGADAVALTDEDGEVVGSHAAGASSAAKLESALARDDPPVTAGSRSTQVQLPGSAGAVLALTSPYAPFFGSEEFALLRSLGTFTHLALERSRVHAQEREARQALEDADELKTQFIALASHELRTPAAVVHGIAQTLNMRGDELDEDQQHVLRRTLWEQTERLRRLVDQLLDLSRLEANGIRIDVERFPVRSRVEELVLMVASERMHEIEIDVPQDLEAIADPNAFDRIVSNLIVNAFRYGEPPVLVHAEQRDRHFRLTVEDHGDGVPDEFVPRLFERFTRSGDSTRQPGGAGLGLAIAKSYANAQGGDLFYQPASPHGACFQLVLPRPAHATSAR